MENATYAGITRQDGLKAELRVIANNIANASTTGFKAESVIFAEHIKALGGGHASLSMATAEARSTVLTQGGLAATGGTYDLAIEGDGFFLVETSAGQRLTRAGAFTPNGEGELVNMDGHRVLDTGGAPVFIPQGAGTIGIAPDGTVSAGGQPISQIGLVMPIEQSDLTREGGTLFLAEKGFEPAPNGQIIQGYLEQSNVNPVTQIGRMIEVQRAYELGQSFVEKEDERMRAVFRAMGR